MAGTFDMLRANDLIFNYVVSNWLMGKQPPAFDILAWNSDSTRMPAAMHSFYLRNCYVQNKFAKGELELAGQRLDLRTSTRTCTSSPPSTTTSCRGQSSYATVQPRRRDDPVRPVQRWPHRRHRQPAGAQGVVRDPATSTRSPPKPGGRRRPRAGLVVGGLGALGGQRAGDLVDPPTTGSDSQPVLGDGPGDYVRT